MQETPHQPRLRLVGGSGIEEVPSIPARHPIVEMILEDLCDAAIASTTSDDPAAALRIALHHAYEQLVGTLPMAPL